MPHAHKHSSVCLQNINDLIHSPLIVSDDTAILHKTEHSSYLLSRTSLREFLASIHIPKAMLKDEEIIF